MDHGRPAMARVVGMNFLEKLIAKQVAKRVRKEIEMNGWKTKTAGVGGILAGAGLVIAGLVGEKFDFELVKQGVGAIVAGLGALGLGHKLDKLTAAAKGTHLE